MTGDIESSVTEGETAAELFTSLYFGVTELT